MDIFKDYAKYYDLFYKDKDYKAEADYVDYLIQKNSVSAGKEMLVIGCGTGMHDRFFIVKGYSVDAFDLSPDMLGIAAVRNPKVNYFRSSIKEFNSKKKYDFIISLFHVMSYQTTNEEVDSLFKIVRNNLKPGGSYLFDSWYGPAVLTEKPSMKIREIEYKNGKIKRTAAPQLIAEANMVVVKYKINGDKPESENIEEIHKMRYFFLPELKLFAGNNSCEMKFSYEWMTEKMPSVNSWNICFGGTIMEKQIT